MRPGRRACCGGRSRPADEAEGEASLLLFESSSSPPTPPASPLLLPFQPHSSEAFRGCAFGEKREAVNPSPPLPPSSPSFSSFYFSSQTRRRHVTLQSLSLLLVFFSFPPRQQEGGGPSGFFCFSTFDEGRRETPSSSCFSSFSSSSFVSFAAAALCSTNICVNGACYETGGLQTCVCDMPFTGPLCEGVLSMCSDGCGIRASTGIDCSSALCSLGTCQDTNTAPFFKCECGDFFTGDNCETHNNPCTNPAANPCGEGTCTFAPGKGSGTVTCTCSSDYEAAAGAGVTTVKWGSSEVIQGPPCTYAVRTAPAGQPPSERLAPSKALLGSGSPLPTVCII
ncbi:hypothetical protein Efla_002656 [Eimeria flavescens]